jgi:hypothetical protein
MKPRFKDKMMQGIYELGLRASYPIPIDFKTGILGGSMRVAWEDGYLGKQVTRYARNDLGYAAYVSGKEVARREKIQAKKTIKKVNTENNERNALRSANSQMPRKDPSLGGG